MLRIAILVSVLGGVAFAEPDAPRRIVVPIGETVETDVGYLRGFACDDPSILVAELKTKSETSNVFSVKGLTAGKTSCRVGTNPLQPSVVFEVRVESRPRRR